VLLAFEKSFEERQTDFEGPLFEGKTFPERDHNSQPSDHGFEPGWNVRNMVTRQGTPKKMGLIRNETWCIL
jgi:hypothetical protein